MQTTLELARTKALRAESDRDEAVREGNIARAELEELAQA
jgi:hypothetical protein